MKEWEKYKTIPIVKVAKKIGIDILGKNKAKCFSGTHKDQNPSLSFDSKRNIFKCFACGIKGNSIELVKQYYRVDFRDALKWLDSNFFYENSRFQLNRDIKNHKFSKERIQKKISHYQPDIEIYNYLTLNNTLSNKGKAYLSKRFFTNDSIKTFNIFDLSNPKKTIQDLKAIFGEEKLVKCGLLKNQSGIIKPVWWDYVIIFPFIKKSNTLYLQGRRLQNIEKYGKYIGLSGVEKPIFNEEIINQTSIEKTIYICEGIPDAILAIQCGLPSIAILGATSFSEKWISFLSKHKIAIIPDNDVQGSKMAQSIKILFQKIGKPVQILKVPVGKDFSEYIEYLKGN